MMSSHLLCYWLGFFNQSFAISFGSFSARPSVLLAVSGNVWDSSLFSSLCSFTALLSLTANIAQRINLSKLFSVHPTPPPSQPIKLRWRHLLYWSSFPQWINSRSKQGSRPTFLTSLRFPFISSLSNFLWYLNIAKGQKLYDGMHLCGLKSPAVWRQHLNPQWASSWPGERKVYIFPAPALTPLLAS